MACTALVKLHGPGFASSALCHHPSCCSLVVKGLARAYQSSTFSINVDQWTNASNPDRMYSGVGADPSYAIDGRSEGEPLAPALGAGGGPLRYVFWPVDQCEGCRVRKTHVVSPRCVGWSGSGTGVGRRVSPPPHPTPPRPHPHPHPTAFL